MSGLSLLVVFGGAGCGALLRWWLGGLLNPVFPTLPLGTLAANLVGGLLVGAASAYFTQHGALPPEWRLLVITGFCGGLTTFSSFSAEITLLLQQGRLAWACGTLGAHVLGSLLMTFAGLASYQLLGK